MSGIVRVNNPPSWDDTSGRNAPYLISIKEGNGGGTVTGYMPEQLSETIASRWEPLMSWSPTGMLKFAAALAGKGGQFAWQNALIWSGQDPYTLDIPMEFHAKTDAKADVYDKCQKLMAMASPDASNGRFSLMAPPGPNLAPQAIQDMLGSAGHTAANILEGLAFENAPAEIRSLTTQAQASAKGALQNAPEGRPISVYIGNIRAIHKCVILNVSVTYGAPLDPNGYPLKAEANVSIQMAEVFTRQHAGG